MREVPMPECDKLLEVKGDSQVIGEFLEWYRAQGARTRRGSIEQVLANYFEIDLRRVEQERSALLEAIRAGDDT